MSKKKRPRWEGPAVLKPLSHYDVKYSEYIRPIEKQNDPHVTDYRKENESHGN